MNATAATYAALLLALALLIAGVLLVAVALTRRASGLRTRLRNARLSHRHRRT